MPPHPAQDSFPWNDHRHLVEHRDRAQCRFGLGRPGRNQRSQGFQGLEAYPKWDSRRCLSHIEGIPCIIVAAMTVRRRFSVPHYLARKDLIGRNHAQNEGEVPPLHRPEEEFGGTLTKDVEHKLHVLHIGVFDRFRRVLYLFPRLTS